jgi:hypothetical protein
MDIQASISELINMIMNIDNVEFIENLKKLISRERTDFWDELSLSEKKEIEKGIKQLDKNERISYNNFLKKIS